MGGATWTVVEGELTYDVTWLSVHGNVNNCEMAFEDDFMSNVRSIRTLFPCSVCRGVKHMQKPN